MLSFRQSSMAGKEDSQPSMGIWESCSSRGADLSVAYFAPAAVISLLTLAIHSGDWARLIMTHAALTPLFNSAAKIAEMKNY